MAAASNNADAFRNLPSVDKVLAEPALADMLAHVKRDMVVDAVRDELGEVRILWPFVPSRFGLVARRSCTSECVCQ